MARADNAIKSPALPSQNAPDNIPHTITQDTVVDSAAMIANPLLKEQIEADHSPVTGDQTAWGLAVNQITTADMVLGYSDNGMNYIGINSLAQILEFPLKVSPYDKTVTGWFVREENQLNLNKYNVSLRGHNRTLKKDQIKFFNDEIYIRSDVLAEWLSGEFSFDTNAMVLTISSKHPFPFEEKLAREQKKLKLNRGAPESEADLIKIPDPYRRMDVPLIDVNATQTVNKNDDQNTTTTSNYNILVKGDLAYHTSEIFLSGDLAHDALSEAHLKLSKTSEDNKLLGKLHASKYEIGDIDSMTQSLISQSARGRGVALSNRALYRSDQFDQVSFRGFVTPGWDVELYRNGDLIDIQSVGTDGTYEFVNVPIYFGRNLFRVVQYGPQGQILEETRQFYAGSTLLDKSDFTYNVSLSDNNHSVLGINDSDSPTEGLRMISEFEYGVSKYNTAALGFSSLQHDDKIHNYVMGGWRTGFRGILASLDAAYDIEDQSTAQKISMNTTIGKADIRYQDSFYQDFISDENQNDTEQKDRSTILDTNFYIGKTQNNPLSVNMGAERKVFSSGDTSSILRSRFSKSFIGVNVSDLIQKEFGRTDNLTNTLTLRTSHGKFLLGANLDYNIQPDSKFTGADVTAQYDLSEDKMGRLTFQTDANDNYSGTASMTFDMDKYGLSVFTGGNNNRDYFAGVGLNFSFTKLPKINKWYFQSRPMADSGAVLMEAYNDQNNNGFRDLGEESIPDVKFNQGGRDLRTVSSSYSFLAPLVADHPVKLGVNKDGIQDPMKATKHAGYKITPRQGHVTVIDVPVYNVSLLEGHVSNTKSKASIPLTGTKIILPDMHDKTIAETIAEFDGYYVFDKVIPGSYKVKVSLQDGSVITQPEIFTAEGQQFYTMDISLN